MHGAWLLVFVAVLPGVLTMIPTSSLAAVLVVAVFKLVNVKALQEIWRQDRREITIYAVTAATIIFWGVLPGVLLGIVLALAKLLYTLGHLDIHRVDDPEHSRTILYLQGTATFLSLPRLATSLERIPTGTELHVHFDRLDLIDHACLDLLVNWKRRHENTGGSLVLDWEGLHAKFCPRASKPIAAHVPVTGDRPTEVMPRIAFLRQGWQLVRNKAS
jgi:MFS superfamily sulfate permease-like transporter